MYNEYYLYFNLYNKYYLLYFINNILFIYNKLYKIF